MPRSGRVLLAIAGEGDDWRVLRDYVGSVYPMDLVEISHLDFAADALDLLPPLYDIDVALVVVEPFSSRELSDRHVGMISHIVGLLHGRLGPSRVLLLSEMTDAPLLPGTGVAEVSFVAGEIFTIFPRVQELLPALTTPLIVKVPVGAGPHPRPLVEARPSTAIFVSYARFDSDRINQLTADLTHLGDQLWFDRYITGGQRWWDMILDQIMDCSLFVLALSLDSIRSPWCVLEAEWARQLGRPILPVRIDDVDLALVPTWIRSLQILPMLERSADEVLGMARAVRELTRDPVPLPEPLPDRPALPAGPFDEERQKLARLELSAMDQLKLVAVLRAGLDDPARRDEAVELLRLLAARDDVTKVVDQQCTAALAPLDPPAAPTAAPAGPEPAPAPPGDEEGWAR